MKFTYTAIVLLLCAFGSSAAAQEKDQLNRNAGVDSSNSPNRKFNPIADAATDIRNATIEAQKSGKHILLDVGGDWCPWCHLLDELFDSNRDVQKLLEDHFVVVKVYYGSENKNEQVLSRYGKTLGIPHFFVLDEAGTLLHSQHVVELQERGAYSAAKVRDFLVRWSPENLTTQDARAAVTGQTKPDRSQ